jgi:hypothetical protein
MDGEDLVRLASHYTSSKDITLLTGTDLENVRFRRALLDTVFEMGRHYLCIPSSTFIRSL